LSLLEEKETQGRRMFFNNNFEEAKMSLKSSGALAPSRYPPKGVRQRLGEATFQILAYLYPAHLMIEKKQTISILDSALRRF